MNYEDLFALVKTRRSVRRFKSEPVPRETVGKILEAARFAPSGGNSQPWEFVVVEDPEMKKGLSKGIGLQIREEVKADPTIARGIAVQPFLYTAPVLIIVCGDPRLREVYPAWMDRDMLLRQSLSNCVYTIQLAATCFGLSTAWATIQGGPTESEVKKALGIPTGYTVDHIVPLGYADDEAEGKQATLRTVKERAGFRRALEEVLHYERYDMGKHRTDTQVKEFIWSRTITRIPDL